MAKGDGTWATGSWKGCHLSHGQLVTTVIWIWLGRLLGKVNAEIPLHQILFRRNPSPSVPGACGQQGRGLTSDPSAGALAGGVPAG